MRTTIVMLSVDEGHLLEESLPAAMAQADAEVLVVDNASTDLTETVVEACGARYMRLRDRRSYAAAINAGIAASDGEAVLLLNADCVVAGDFLEHLTRRLHDETLGSVAPKLIRASSVDPGDRLEVLDAAAMTIDRRRKNGLVGHNAPSTDYATRAEVFGADDYRRTVDILRHFYNIILTDCGTGIMHSAMSAILDLAHSIVLVSSPAIDAARSASATLDWLLQHGHSGLVREAHVVLSASRPGSAALKQLAAIVRGYVGFELQWDLQLILKRGEVPAAQLGTGAGLGKGTRLGWTSWSVSGTRTRDANDVVLANTALS